MNNSTTKNIFKKVFLVLYSLLLVGITAAVPVMAAAGDLTKEIVFYAASENQELEDSEIQKEIKEKGKLYKLVDVQYSAGDRITKKVELKDLKEKKAAKQRAFEIDGTDTVFFLDKDKTKYEEREPEQVRQEATYVYEARDPFSFTADSTRTMTDANGRQFTGTLESTQRGDIYTESTTINGTFTAPQDAKYFTFGESNALLPINANAPQWSGYEKDILDYLGLSDETYTITGARWTNTEKSGGNVTRTAAFTVSRNVADYSCVYAGTREAAENERGNASITANAVYYAYPITATLIYEKQVSTMQKVMMAGAGILIIAAGTVAALSIMSRKKKKEEEQAL